MRIQVRSRTNRDAAPQLQERLGDYCSYCERQIETHLAVEHIKPKSHDPGLRRAWNNFLLACTNCNSSKGGTPVNVADFLSRSKGLDWRPKNGSYESAFATPSTHSGVSIMTVVESLV